MAQALSKFKRPVNGNGTHSYYADGYGVQSVDFGSASYKWDSMGLASADNYNSLLIYHCAVSVDMEFGPDASGTLLSTASSALKKYFIYSKEIIQVKRYSDDQKWMDLLNDELRNGRPIIYGGDADDGTPGHAFNIDGVINSVYYHINWGWGGTNNGYYVINSFKPGGNDFTKNHSAIIHIQPYYYPTDILLSDTVVLLNVPQGSKIGVVSVTDEAVNNTYSLTVISDSLFNGESWVMDYYLNGDTLKTGRTFSATDGPTDTVSITVTDKFDNFIKKKIALKLGTSPTGIYDPVSINIRDLLFYPNPASGQIYIKQRNERELISLKIYSISGILIRQIDNLSDSTRQLYGLQPGIYLFKAEMSDRSSVREKIVVY
jgi:hypothetical protein